MTTRTKRIIAALIIFGGLFLLFSVHGVRIYRHYHVKTHGSQVAATVMQKHQDTQGNWLTIAIVPIDPGSMTWDVLVDRETWKAYSTGDAISVYYSESYPDRVVPVQGGVEGRIGLFLLLLIIIAGILYLVLFRALRAR